MELLFLLAFTLHNLEEGIWLPRWSKHAGKYYSPVSNREFHFALIVITSVGYFITFLFLLFGQTSEAFKYIFLGFVVMMSINSIFPHLLATIVLKRYAPGTLTGLLLNLPIGIAIFINSLETGMQLHLIIISGVIITVLSIAALRPLFKLGNKLIDEY
ncbi:hypothetical protein SPSIL_030210 [Sporomusa silvacetica DSM 10669]|uniref:HXXEE domain-containing protein n=1 Tax=Sporomusa silvacetica DSM 10669 TaxID=1123289 RepID=A0ABZ3IMH9_9FIRM|nr:HXXEE domain-containing protein [Sporomusa silvacetica]OZC14388.1 hypothetical protein SPSIL_48770 [Sporomusa silvacetica DSM 10669]